MQQTTGSPTRAATRPHKARGLAVFSLLALASSGCAGAHWASAVVYTQGTPNLSPSEQPSPYAAEMTSVVVPPSNDGKPWPNGCPAAGRLFVAYGNFSDPNRGTSLSYSQDLNCLGSPQCMREVLRGLPDAPQSDRRGLVWVHSQPGPDGRCQQAGPSLPGSESHPEFPHAWNVTDMGLLRVPLLVAGPQGTSEIKGGRILHFWQAFRAVAPPLPVIDVQRWGGDEAPAPSCASLVRHVGVMVRHSDDCGATWTEPRFIDFAEMNDRRGQRIFPMELPSRTGNLLVRGKGLHWGTDRFEVYADPFGPPGDPRRAMYLTGLVVVPDPARGDPAGEQRREALLRSLDGGVTWETAFAFPDWGGAAKVMTSLPSGRLFVGRCIGGIQGKQRFQLFWFDDMGTTLKGWTFLEHLQNGAPIECRSIPPKAMFGSVNNNLVEDNLARLGSTRSRDAILASYTSVEGDRQVAYVLRVEIDRSSRCEQAGQTPSDCVHITQERKIEGQEDRSVRHIDLIESDRMEFSPASDEVPPVVFSYLEWPSARNPGAGALARFQVRTDEGLSDTGTLSLSQGRPSPWMPKVTSRTFIGDYGYGAFFSEQTPKKPTLYFFWPWAESDPAVPADNQVLRGNVIKLYKK